MRKQRGQSLIEVFVAIGVGVLMLGGITSAFSIILRTNDFAEKSRNAAVLNDGLSELVRSFADGNWPGLYGLSHGSLVRYHLINSEGTIAAQSGKETVAYGVFDYSRSFYVDNVSRDGSGNIEAAYNSANDDPSTQKITVETDYELSGLLRTISSEFYVTRMRNFIFNQTDWSGGDSQEGPITSANDRFTSKVNVDYSTTPGSIVPVTNDQVNIYVADLDNDRIQKFDANGTFLLKWGTNGSGNGQFNKPYGVAIDSLNNIYVADKDNDRIQKFDSNGNYLTQWGSGGSGDGQFGHPQGIAIDSSGNVYVVDLDHDRIQKFDANGTFLLKWGTNGNNSGQFNKPQDVAVDSSGNVYVTDQDNNRVQKFTSGGVYVAQWGSNGSGDGQFKKPIGIGVDNLDNVYVADRDNDRVQKFNSSGTFLAKWGSSGSGNGQFQKPQGVTADQLNNIYVADGDNHRIQKFDSNGVYLTKWGKAGGASGNGNGEFNHPRGLEYIPPSCSGNCSLTSSIFDSGIAGQDPDPILQSWTSTNSFPVGTSEHASVVYNGYVYVIGGQGGTGKEVYYAPINADGTVGTWNTTTSLPAMRQAPTSVVYNGYVYVMGGYSGSYQSTVYYAQLNANGTVGTWNTTTAMPGPRYRASSAVYNGFVYVLGGRSSASTYNSTVYYAQLNANGTVGAWSTGTALPITLSGQSTSVANGYIYVTGGYNGSYQSTVYYAQLNGNGSVGAWNTNANALLEVRGLHRSAVLNGYVYAIGGNGNGGVHLSTINYARLNGDGSVGVWSSSASSVARQSPGVVDYDDRVYLFGGYNGGDTATVYYASPPASTGGASLNTIMWQGSQPPDSAVKFQIASSNSSSGPWNYLGSDGSTATYYSPAGPNIQKIVRPADHGSKRYFRYRIFFDVIGGAVPRVDDVIMSFSR